MELENSQNNQLEERLESLESKLDDLIKGQNKLLSARRWGTVWKILTFILVFVLPMYLSYIAMQNFMGSDMFKSLTNTLPAINQQIPANSANSQIDVNAILKLIKDQNK